MNYVIITGSFRVGHSRCGCDTKYFVLVPFLAVGSSFHGTHPDSKVIFKKNRKVSKLNEMLHFKNPVGPRKTGRNNYKDAIKASFTTI